MYYPLAVFTSVFALLPIVGNLAAETPAVLLEKAIHAEESAGDVNEAIRLYQQIVNDAQANRQYIAQAQYRLGLCLQKVNRLNEAQAAFDRLISEFPEQKELIAQARKLMPGPAFPEIVGCRIRETLSLRLEPPRPGWEKETPTREFTVSEYTIVNIKWDLDPALAAKTQSFALHVEDFGSYLPAASARSHEVGGPESKSGTSPGLKASSDSRDLTAGNYTIRIGAYDAKKKTFGVDGDHLIAVATAKLTVKPLPRTQINVSSIKPDGTIESRFVGQQTNDDLRDVTSNSFVNDDTINVTAMSDDDGRPLKFTTRHDRQRSSYRYEVTLNRPVPPGKPLLYANEITAGGGIRPVAGKPDEFQFHMKHWPSTGEPTRRIEIYRLPKGAELLETTPKDMARRTVNEHIELFVEKMIPAGGNILTAFRYRLPGAVLASRPVTATQPGIEPMKLKPATWSDGEVMRLRIRSEAGGEIGTVFYSSEAIKAGTKDAWRIESTMVIALVDMLQFTRVDAERDSFAPIAGRTYNSEIGDFRAEYGSSKVKLTTGTKDRSKSRDINLEQTAYDNEQAIYVIRRMPLAEGYHSTFPIFPVMGGSVLDCDIEVAAKEKVSVPAGAYECWKVMLAVTSGGARLLQHTLWFSSDAHQYLVKYEGDAVMELAEVLKRDPKSPAVFRNERLGVGMTAPPGWSFYSNPSPKGYMMSTYLLSPELKVWALLTVAPHGSVFDSARAAAQGDIETLKGFFKGYTVRADSWAEQKVAGLPAARYVADYQDEGKPMVEYRTYILGKSMVYWFVFRIEKNEFDDAKAELDRIVDGFTGK